MSQPIPPSNILPIRSPIPAPAARPLCVLGDRITLEARSDTWTATDWCMFHLACQPQNSPPLHTHPWDECFRVLAGRLRVQIDDRIHDLNPGETAFVPGGSAHSYRALAAGTEALVIFGSLDPIAFFSDLDGLADIETVMERAARHGVVPVGPPVAA
jgi:mannose-6-phosphate isomerase-like protein (cupin superfamily)